MRKLFTFFATFFCVGILPYSATYASDVYSITLDGNGATSPSVPNIIYTKPGVNEAYLDKECTQSIMRSVTLPHRVYQITYDGNGGRVYDNNQFIQTTKKSQTWSFRGYFSEKNGGVAYGGGSTYFIITQNGYDALAQTPSDQTWYAQWKDHGMNQTLLGTLAPSGYSFMGWYDAPVGGNLIGMDGDTYIASESITLYAQWKILEVTCQPGMYLPAGYTTCQTCPTGHYCEATEYGKSRYFYNPDQDQGITGVCKSGYNDGRRRLGTAWSNGMPAYHVNLNAFAAGCHTCARAYNDSGPYDDGYVATGDLPTDHDEESDCKKTITLVTHADSGTTYKDIVCSRGVECDFGSVSGTSKRGLPFTGGWGTSETCTATTTKFINPSGQYGKYYYACSACSGEFEFVDGACQPCNRENAIAYKPEEGCQVLKCHTGFHPDGDQCVNDIKTCDALNATEATSVWDSEHGEYSACMATQCISGFHVEYGICVKNSAVCEIANGIGIREWNERKKMWDDCIVTSCVAGYQPDNLARKCIVCPNNFGALGEVAVARWKNGCEIAECLYQGELYDLRDNECVQICPMKKYNDETGTMQWNPTTQKCEYECYSGYVQW